MFGVIDDDDDDDGGVGDGVAVADQNSQTQNAA